MDEGHGDAAFAYCRCYPLEIAAVGVIGVFIATAGTIATWGRGPEFGPHWYALAVIAIALPCAWIGGKLAPMTRVSR